MSIHKNQAGRYTVRWREGQKNRSRTFDRRKDALAYDDARRRERQLGAFATAEPSSLTLDEFSAQWQRDGSAAWEATTTAQRKWTMDKWVLPFIGGIPLRELGPERVRAFRADIIASGCTPKASNSVMRVLSACLATAVEYGLIPMNPCLGVKKVRVPAPDRAALSDDAVARIMSNMPTDRDRRVMCLLICGLRPAEVVGMKWVDMSAESLVVRRSVQKGIERPTKTGLERRVPIPLEARISPPVHPDSEYVAPGLGGGPLNWPMWTRRVWRPACDKAGVTATPYEMRHTAASRLIRSGVDMITAASIMGHSVQVMSQTYLHLIRPEDE
jgi:hypothetical protein